MKIHAPNKNYTGVSASVAFCSGVGETEDPYLLDWFRGHGYEVEETEIEPPNEEIEIETGADPGPDTIPEPEKKKAASKKVGE